MVCKDYYFENGCCFKLAYNEQGFAFGGAFGKRQARN